MRQRHQHQGARNQPQRPQAEPGQHQPPDSTYSVVTNNYLRGGGDGYVMFGTEGKTAHEYGPTLADVVANYLAVNSPYRPFLDGRIKTK